MPPFPLAQTQQHPLTLRMPTPQMQQPPVMPRRVGLLERLFPAPQQYQGLLSPEMLSGARRDMLLRLGAGLLAGSGPRAVGSPGSGFGERLGQALGQVPNWNDTLAGLAQQQMALRPKPGEVSQVDAGDRIIFYDKQTGQKVGESQKGATPEQPGAAADQRTSEYFDRAGKMYDQYQRQTATERAVAQNYQAVLSADPTPAGDIALLFGFMKMIDPTSVVRESEFATAENAGSVPTRVRALYNKLLTERGRLTAAQRADFLQQAHNRAQRTREGLQRVMKEYERRGSRFGLEGEDVAYDYFSGVAIPRRSATPSDGAADAELDW